MAGVLGVPIPLPNPSILGIGTKVPSNAAKRVSALTLLRNAGFTGTSSDGEPADRAALAIMHRESGGRADAVNGAPCSAHGDHAVGLMQICCPMHMPVADAKDPEKNLAKAHDLYVAAGNSFARDWPTWHRGEWRTAKDMLITVGPNSVGGAITGAASDVAGEAAGVVDAALGPVDEIASALLSRDTWFRVGKGFLGGLVVVIGTGAIVAIAAKPLAKQANKIPKL